MCITPLVTLGPYSAEPGDEFQHDERLWKIVVGPQIETFHSFVHVAARGEQHHRNGLTGLA